MWMARIARNGEITMLPDQTAPAYTTPSLKYFREHDRTLVRITQAKAEELFELGFSFAAYHLADAPFILVGEPA